MQNTKNIKETRLLHCYDMLSFVTEVEKAVKEGFSLDLVSNEHCPQQIGWQFITTMVKYEEQAEETAVEGSKTPVEASEIASEGVSSQEVAKGLVEAPKRGRKAKGE